MSEKVSRATQIMAFLAGSGETLTSSTIVEAGNFDFPSKNIAAYMKPAITKGWVEHTGEGYAITAAGRTALLGPQPPKKKTKAAKKSKKAASKPAKAPASPAKQAGEQFRVGLFNDGSMAILAKLGSLELSAEEACELAGFCADRFA